ncbi:hypothetical protein NRK67_01720 [Fusobacteria bacterium ZRK30]|nr:hypothetical protein NRK67_01720 [Fusobacteria bacterium ZRK30]
MMEFLSMLKTTDFFKNLPDFNNTISLFIGVIFSRAATYFSSEERISTKTMLINFIPNLFSLALELFIAVICYIILSLKKELSFIWILLIGAVAKQLASFILELASKKGKKILEAIFQGE